MWGGFNCKMVKAKKIELTQEELKEVLDYNPETGIFTWKVSNSNKATIGAVAGGCNVKGYVVIGHKKQRYYAHRLAWLYINGSIENEEIDHIDGDKFNNRISNLRPCTKSQNMQNVKIRVTNKSGFKGVSFHKASGKWLASATLCGKQVYLGLYTTPKEASAIYESWCRTNRQNFHRPTTNEKVC